MASTKHSDQGIRQLKTFYVPVIATALGAFLLCSVADAGHFYSIPVSKESKKAQELGFSIKLTPNGQQSGLEGTTTFAFRAPMNLQFHGLFRAILQIKDGEKLVARIPLELIKEKSGEFTCHFQLDTKIATKSTLQLVCQNGDLLSGVVYEVDLSSYLEDPKEK
ncbi:MAG: hypothetical protein K8T25_10185 [Planctomycetia bacterium]|nr:hypothetical protein [Planctomycetia bacterium]